MSSEGFGESDVGLDAGPAERHGAPCVRVQATARLEHYGFARNGNGNGAAGASARESRQVTWPGHGAAGHGRSTTPPRWGRAPRWPAPP